MSIEIKGISKAFGEFRALDNVNLKVESGELVALLGPSGCGKTTLLRLIAGLESPDSGAILLSGEDTTELKPREKGVGFVFQHFALFRRMNVFENVAFGLKVIKGKNKPTKQEIHDRVMHLLTMVQMEWAIKRFPSQLSGGQRQRVALARALAVGPKVLLLDEPFSALDAKVRLELRRWLRRLHDEIHVTSVFVTHDQEEALELADKIVIINSGKIEQVGTPEEVYDNPANAFVYNFLGNVNVFHGRMKDGQVSLGADGTNHPEAAGSTPAQGFIRPHEIGINLQRTSESDWEAVIQDARIIGSQMALDLKSPAYDGLIEAEVPREYFRNLGLKKGDRVFVSLEKARVFSDPDYVI